MLDDEQHERDGMVSGQRPLTSADVARRAGVSRTTVSYVLNGITNQRISERTRERVLVAARELNYQLQPAAQTLRKGHSDDIYFIVNRPLTLFMSALIKAMRQRAQELGYILAVYFYDDNTEEDWRTLLLHLFAQRPAGIIASTDQINQEEVELAKSRGAGAYVFLSDTSVEYAPTVGLQAYEAGNLVARHLLERGHQRIGLIAPQNKYQAYMVPSRVSGMRAALERESRGDLCMYSMYEATLEEARRVVYAIRHDPAPPTALHGFNDEYCFHLLRAFYEQNIRVPEDIAVVGTDDVFFCALSRPSLTSIRFNIASLGKRAVDIIDHLVRPEKKEMILEPLPPPTLVHRESS